MVHAQQFVPKNPSANPQFSRGWGGCFEIWKHRENAHLQAQLSTQRVFKNKFFFDVQLVKSKK